MRLKHIISDSTNELEKKARDFVEGEKDKDNKAVAGNGEVRSDRSASVSSNGSHPKQLVIDMTVNGEHEASHGSQCQLNTESDSFWELGQFKRTVKRVDDGHHACQQLMHMVKERGEIETAYAKQLRAWSKKWNESIDKELDLTLGIDYGSSQQAWRACLTEADAIADMHQRIRDRLMDEVYNTVKMWQKDNYHTKALVGGLKESKEIEDEFKKAQKPWAKLYSHVERAKKNFHSACKTERTAINQDKNARGDPNVTPEAQKKLSEKVEQCRKDREKYTDAYNRALADLNNYNGKYMEDMTMVFEKCQDMDGARLKFFKEMLFNVHKCLDTSSDPKLAKIYQEYWSTVNRSEPAADLKFWAQSHGTEMPMNWPAFEDFADDLDTLYAAEEAKKAVAPSTSGLPPPKNPEYSPEMRNIAGKKGKQTELANAGGVILIRQKNNSHQTDAAGADNRQSMPATTTANPASASGSPHSQATTSSTPPPADPARPASTAADYSTNGSSSDGLTDDGKPGVRVKALYDYEAQEDDELSLSKGDVFEKLEEPDEQGWCQGRKEGRLGLYPANYAAPVVA